MRSDLLCNDKHKDSVYHIDNFEKNRFFKFYFSNYKFGKNYKIIIG